MRIVAPTHKDCSLVYRRERFCFEIIYVYVYSQIAIMGGRKTLLAALALYSSTGDC